MNKINYMAVSQQQLNSLALGLDIEHRCIYLFGGIDASNAYRFISLFKWMDRYPGPIHIVLNSEGGDVDEGFAIYECLRTANNPTLVEGCGLIASAAVPIFLAGTVRFLNPETRVMIHNMSLEVDGTLNSNLIKAVHGFTEETNKRYHEIIAERTGRSIKDVKGWCEEERYFSATDAVKFGFADKIVATRQNPKSFEEGMQQIKASMESDEFVGKPGDEEPPPPPPKKQKAKKKAKKVKS